MKERLAYYCGRWIPEAEVSIPLADLGFTMGITVTERLRTFGGKLFRQAQHLERIRHSMEIIGLDAKLHTAELQWALDEYLTRHKSLFVPGDDWALVAFVTPGSGARPTVCVHGFPLAFGDWADDYDTGVEMFVSRHRQVPPNCWPPELKCRSRMHYYLADHEARQRQPRARAILLDQEGYVGEGSTANLAVYHPDQGVVTPIPTKVLPGVTINVVSELAQAAGIDFAERDISLDELMAAHEVWLVSTSVCMLPVVKVDEQPIGCGQPGPVFGQLMTDWHRLTGIDIAAQARTFADRGA